MSNSCFNLYLNFLIEGISVTGVSVKGATKQPLPQEKYNIFKEMLAERLNTFGLAKDVTAIRMKRLNTLLKSAIHSNCRKVNSKYRV